MAEPVCMLHPDGRVRRDGFYGRKKEFVRWECVPADGDKPHYLKRSQQMDMRSKLVGGVHGSCDECEREWQATEGLHSAAYDKFVLRAKAETLVRIAEGGLSMRGAAIEARKLAEELRGTHRHSLPPLSRDGRLARDWVLQYTGILSEEYLPREWPYAITVDSFDVRLSGFDQHGKPKKKGRYLYSVLGVVGYETGSTRGQPWLFMAFAGEGEKQFREFFQRLDGAPSVVVCDAAKAPRNAAAWAFPKATVYPCAHHQFSNLQRHLNRAELWNNRRQIYRLLRTEGAAMSDAKRIEEVFAMLDRFVRADRAKMSERMAKNVPAIAKWMERNREDIRASAQASYWPRTTDHLEERLDVIQRRLGDRRRAFRNLHRLNAVLALYTMQMRGDASATAWTRILRENHERHDGKPPPRRIYDGKIIHPR